MTKDELITKLNELPNLPVVVELDCDTLRSKDVKNIEVKKVKKLKKFDYHLQEYDDSNRSLERVDSQPIIEVIWIS